MADSEATEWASQMMIGYNHCIYCICVQDAKKSHFDWIYNMFSVR